MCRFAAEKYPDIPAIFTADLNSLPDSTAYRTMTTCYKDTRFVAADSRYYGTFHATHPEDMGDYTIDYVLCTPSLEVKAYCTVTAGRKNTKGRFAFALNP